jgi:hypothetical protein
VRAGGDATVTHHDFGPDERINRDERVRVCHSL